MSSALNKNKHPIILMSIFRLIAALLLTCLVASAAPANLPPAATRELSVKTNGIIASPVNFFQANIIPGDNITIVTNGDGRIVLHSAAGTGMASTNGLASTNYVQDSTMVSVKWPEFGAKGDSTDATAAFQAAVNKAHVNNILDGKSGKALFVPEGNYLITDTIHLPADIKLRFENIGTTRIFSTVSNAPTFEYAADSYFRAATNVFYVQSIDIADVAIFYTGATPVTTNCIALKIVGQTNATHLKLRNIRIDRDDSVTNGFYGGIEIENVIIGELAFPWVSTRTRGIDGSFGIRINNCVAGQNNNNLFIVGAYTIDCGTYGMKLSKMRRTKVVSSNVERNIIGLWADDVSYGCDLFMGAEFNQYNYILTNCYGIKTDFSMASDSNTVDGVVINNSAVDLTISGAGYSSLPSGYTYRFNSGYGSVRFNTNFVRPFALGFGGGNSIANPTTYNHNQMTPGYNYNFVFTNETGGISYKGPQNDTNFISVEDLDGDLKYSLNRRGIAKHYDYMSFETPSTRPSLRWNEATNVGVGYDETWFYLMNETNKLSLRRGRRGVLLADNMNLNAAETNTLVIEPEQPGRTYFVVSGTRLGTHSQSLQLIGDTNGNANIIRSISSGTNPVAPLYIQAAGETVFAASTNANVGIGTFMPLSKLHVEGNISASNVVQIVAGSNVILEETQTPTNKIVTISSSGGSSGTTYVTFDQDINTFSFDSQ